MSNTTADMGAVMRRLAVDAMTSEVLRALAGQSVPCIVLKGAALQQRLYGSAALRPYGDADLLVAPSEVERAGAALASLGFELRFDPRNHPLRIPDPHAQDWIRGGDAVDLHWRLPGAGADGERTWRALAAHTRPLVVGGAPGVALDDAGIALMLALHAAHHGAGVPKPLRDLELGLERIPADAWRDAAALAREIDAIDAFAAGLRAVPAGEVRAHDLRIGPPRAPAARLKAGTPPPAGLAVLHVLETPWREGRARALLDALFPSRQFMRDWFPLARRGRTGLALAYATRLLTRARQLPSALAAARSARG